MAKIYVIMGKSSTGKDTIYSRLKSDSKLQLKTVTMYTTRPKRDGEKDGVEYFFVTDDVYNQYKQDGKIIENREYNTVFGVWRYFTVDDGQIDIKSSNRYLIIATPEAYCNYVTYFGKDKIVPIYIEVDDSTRIHRAIEREDMQECPKYNEMCRRYLADEEDFSSQKLVEAGIVSSYENRNLDKCIEKISRDILN